MQTNQRRHLDAYTNALRQMELAEAAIPESYHMTRTEGVSMTFEEQVKAAAEKAVLAHVSRHQADSERQGTARGASLFGARAHGQDHESGPHPMTHIPAHKGYPDAPQRTLLEQYDLDQSPDYRKGYEDGRLKGFEVGHRYASERPAPASADAAQGGLWKLVPVEPTEDMLFAAEISEARGYIDLYRAMLAAAPQRAEPAQAAQVQPVAWRDHVEQQIYHWRVPIGDENGDHAALYDLIGAHNLESLIDFVCDEYATTPTHTEPAAESATAERERMADALRALLKRDRRNTCMHEDTRRGGSIWEICNECGAKWADDNGGKPEWIEPPEWAAAEAALASHPPTPAAREAVALTDADLDAINAQVMDGDQRGGFIIAFARAVIRALKEKP